MPRLGDPVLNLLQAGIVEEHVATDMTVDMPAMGMPLKCYRFGSDASQSRFYTEYKMYAQPINMILHSPITSYYFTDIEEGSVISSYEDLVRQHVEGFLASAQQYAQITELSKRVSEWEDKILPKLREEVWEISSAFNICITKLFEVTVNHNHRIENCDFLISSLSAFSLI